MTSSRTLLEAVETIGVAAAAGPEKDLFFMKKYFPPQKCFIIFLLPMP